MLSKETTVKNGMIRQKTDDAGIDYDKYLRTKREFEEDLIEATRKNDMKAIQEAKNGLADNEKDWEESVASTNKDSKTKDDFSKPLSIEEIKSLFKSIDPAFAKNLSGVVISPQMAVEKGLKAGLQLSSKGEQFRTGDSKSNAWLSGEAYDEGYVIYTARKQTDQKPYYIVNNKNFATREEAKRYIDSKTKDGGRVYLATHGKYDYYLDDVADKIYAWDNEKKVIALSVTANDPSQYDIIVQRLNKQLTGDSFAPLSQRYKGYDIYVKKLPTGWFEASAVGEKRISGNIEEINRQGTTEKEAVRLLKNYLDSFGG
jgi:hypothetical protein